jgi:hypothetical protein
MLTAFGTECEASYGGRSLTDMQNLLWRSATKLKSNMVTARYILKQRNEG